MSIELQSRIEELRADYSEVKGKPFAHFFCPILFEDEDVPLCEGHIVNQAFPNSARNWTVQRRDVDNFYGSNFESDFIAIQYQEEHSPGKVLIDRKLSKRFKPKILLDNKSIEHFFVQNTIPEGFTRIDFEHNGRVVQLGLKMPPEDVFAATDQKWEIAISKDARLEAMISLIKAAHLTLFEILGYRYGLSSGSYFVGSQILGQFFRQNRNKSKPDVLKNAPSFFSEFAHMVRPVQVNRLDLQGTITDRLLFVCGWNTGSPWALIVFIRTSQLLHAVMVPVLDQADSAARFFGFLKGENESIEASYCHFDQGSWNINKESTRLLWPKKGLLYP